MNLVEVSPEPMRGEHVLIIPPPSLELRGREVQALTIAQAGVDAAGDLRIRGPDEVIGHPICTYLGGQVDPALTITPDYVKKVLGFQFLHIHQASPFRNRC